MAKQISELTNKATPVGTDEFPIQETGGSTTKKATLLAMLGAGINAVFGTISTNDTTASTSGTTGSIQTDGGIGAAKDIVTDETFKPLGDTSAGDAAAMGYNSIDGAVITGLGSTNDVTIKNDADAIVAQVPTGTTDFDIAGEMSSSSIALGATTDAATVSTTLADYQLKLGGAQSTTFDIGRNIAWGVSGVVTAAINSIDDGTSNAQALGIYTGNAASLDLAVRIASDQKVVCSDTVTIENGIYLGGTAAANLLDDYEEGTWTPVLSDGTNNATASIQSGSYTKIGDSVNIRGYLVTSSLGSVSGAVQISGLPFTVGNSGNDTYSAFNISYGAGLAITAGYSLGGLCQKATTYVPLHVWDVTTGTTALAHTEWSADGGIIFGAEYTTDS